MNYRHTAADGQSLDLPVGKVVCVGRNYASHVAELNNAMPTEPVLFLKPATALCALDEPLIIPRTMGECHHELELTLLIRQRLDRHTNIEFASACWGMGIGLDLTLREKQAELKAKGLPWERAKAFDASAPVSPFVKINALGSGPHYATLRVNGAVRQQLDSSLMLWNMTQLLEAMCAVFTLEPGDIVMTGTPEGVGPLATEDKMEIDFDGQFSIHTQVI